LQQHPAPGAGNAIFSQWFQFDNSIANLLDNGKIQAYNNYSKLPNFL